MGVLLGIIAFPGIVFCLLFLIMNVQTKKPYKKTVIWLVFFVSMLFLSMADFTTNAFGYILLISLFAAFGVLAYFGTKDKPIKTPLITISIVLLLFMINSSSYSSTVDNNKSQQATATSEQTGTEQAAAEQAAAEQAAAEQAAAEQAAAKQAAEQAAVEQAAKQAAEQAAVEQATTSNQTDHNSNEIMPADTKWVRPLGHFYVGVDLYYLNSDNEGIKYATVVGFYEGGQKVECYMYESDTIKIFNRKDPQFIGDFLHIRADDPHLQ
ncbi:hypothetical protein [uncultured Acetobacterium sp.]|uniref:hypothetical protein n=1 Tax=uncultured Acetobacterium sp. TaxID=217139 RepID=UPI0025EDBF11|nr:hypothetical protein [uncultured Acetobacterium sp.]